MYPSQHFYLKNFLNLSFAIFTFNYIQINDIIRAKRITIKI